MLDIFSLKQEIIFALFFLSVLFIIKFLTEIYQQITSNTFQQYYIAYKTDAIEHFGFPPRVTFWL